MTHGCNKPLDVCGHICSGNCSKDHKHASCNAACIQRCDHKRCNKRCRDPCSPCEFLYPVQPLTNRSKQLFLELRAPAVPYALLYGGSFSERSR